MASKVQVALDDGSLIMCNVLERSFSHDVGSRTIWCEHDGKEFMAVRRLGAWRKWSASDRVAPLIEHTEREARAGRRYP